jgi:hypothetical protein
VSSRRGAATEILNTRSLAKLELTRLAPTVLSSPQESDRVLDLLRPAGMAPVAEDASGAIVVEQHQEHPAENVEERPRTRVRAAELAQRLTADPKDEQAHAGDTFNLIAQLNPRLDDAELALLSHAVGNHDDVLIAYRDKRRADRLPR